MKYSPSLILPVVADSCALFCCCFAPVLKLLLLLEMVPLMLLCFFYCFFNLFFWRGEGCLGQINSSILGYYSIA